MRQNNDKFAREIAELKERLSKHKRTNEDSLTILRKIRYGEESFQGKKLQTPKISHRPNYI